MSNNKSNKYEIGLNTLRLIVNLSIIKILFKRRECYVFERKESIKGESFFRKNL